MIITLKFIKEYLEDLTNLDLSLKSRTRNITETRFIAFKLSKVLTRESLTAIGRTYNKDHATVLHGLRKFDDLKDQYYFEDKRNLYEKALNELLKFSDENDGLKKLQTIKEIQRDYEERLQKQTENFIKEIKKQGMIINNFTTSPIFEKISNLPPDEFKELEVRVNAFLQMNAMNQQRKLKRAKIYQGSY